MLSRPLSFLLAIGCISSSWAQPAISTTVALDYGTFRGKQETAFLSFKGVKFADSPRFRAPVMPPQTNLGNVNATSFGKACVRGSSTSPGSDTAEDCLFVNVFVPNGTTEASALPVVVWFHGGGFISGDTHGNTPEVLFNATASPFIFVSLEYRLGPFGFLGGKEVEAGADLNVGLKDQVAALQWVQRYIGKWGGDPRKVTIWGQSAGAGSTMFQLVLNQGQNGGLFRAAIGDSPSDSYQPSKDDGYIQNVFNDFAKNAGCAVADPLACLLAAPIGTLMQSSVTTLNARAPTIYPYAPLVDGSLLAETVSSAFNNGRFARVPVLFGGNTDDGADWASTVAQANATIDTVYAFMQGQFANYSRSTFDEGIDTYYPLSNYNNSLVALVRQMYGEARYVCSPGLITGGAHKFGVPAYDYIYDNPDSDGLTRHSAELTAFYSQTAQDPTGLFASMRKSWTSFIISGAPDSEWQGVTDDEGSPRLHLHPGQVEIREFDEGYRARCEYWRSTDVELQR